MNIFVGCGFLAPKEPAPKPFFNPKGPGISGMASVATSVASFVLPAANTRVPLALAATHSKGVGCCVLFVSPSRLCRSAVVRAEPSPGTQRTKPSSPTMANQPEQPDWLFLLFAPTQQPLATAHSPMAAQGVVILRTGLCDMRTSVITTALSDPALASKSPQGKKHVAVTRAFW